MLTSWDTFVRVLLVRFGPHPYDDHIETLMKLRQVTAVEDYKCRFESIANRLKGLSKRYKLSYFLGGFRDGIRLTVRIFNPSNIHMAYGLARVKEENLQVCKRGFMTFNPRGGGSSNQTRNYIHNQHDKTPIEVQKNTLKQMRERRE